MKLRILIVVLLVAVPGWGCQVSTDTLPSPAAHHPTPPDEGDAAAEARPRATPPGDHPWTVDFLVGIPSGLRVQRALTPADGPAVLLVEGFAGGEAVILPMAGGGLRCRIPIWRGECDSFTIAPGADAYVIAIPGFLTDSSTAVTFITGDVDVGWQHNFSERCAGELGVKLGAGDVFNRDHSLVFPVVSLFGGWSF